ncbi:hypothetical protein [Lactococcus petauri]|uniref:hypothetical protein n=1 Tax=Lactococcus petauri TaxID=1940789 RepID=UPI00254EF9C2|nr:hypothetical protein [Lactococcus petauri]
MNNLQTFILAISSPIAVVVGAAIAPWVDSKREQRKLKREILIKRYHSVYLPFISDLSKLPKEYDIATFNVEMIIKFVELLMQNIEYLDENTSKNVPELYQSMLDMFEYYDGNPEYRNSPILWRTSFGLVISSMLQGSQKITKQLGMPDITGTVSISYRPGQIIYKKVPQYPIQKE